MHPDQIDAVATGPDRRQFLRIGGAGALAAAFLAACGSDESPPPSETGVTTVSVTTVAPAQTTTPEAGSAQTASVMRTMRSVELALVEAYDILLGETADGLVLPGPITYEEDVTTVLAFLRGRHEAHAETLVPLIDQVGGEPVEEANNGVIEGMLVPQLPALTTQVAVVRTVITMESVNASTYAWGAGTLPDRALRAELMTIGGPSARQAAAAGMLRDPNGLLVVPSAMLDTSGPARLPEHMMLTEGMDGAAVPAEPAAADDAAEGEGEGEAGGGAEGEGGEGDENDADGGESSAGFEGNEEEAPNEEPVPEDDGEG